jgi:hypothetical protein
MAELMTSIEIVMDSLPETEGEELGSRRVSPIKSDFTDE